MQTQPYELTKLLQSLTTPRYAAVTLDSGDGCRKKHEKGSHLQESRRFLPSQAQGFPLKINSTICPGLRGNLGFGHSCLFFWTQSKSLREVTRANTTLRTYEAIAKLDARCGLPNTVLPTLRTYSDPDLQPVSKNTIHWRLLSPKD